MKFAIAAATFFLAIQSAAAQHAGHGPGHAQPYAGMEARPIASMSVEEMTGLRAGKGLSLALPAELNGYPGPLHVLDLADRLRLTPDQKSRTERLFADMRSEAIALGEQVIHAETRLDLIFREKVATAETIADATALTGAAKAALRAAHLRYHLTMVAVLTEDQIAVYRSARGYRAP